MLNKWTSVAGSSQNTWEASAGMPACFSYVLAKDSADENVTWITEVWDSLASHDASLSLPRAKPLISAFDRIAVTTPVG